MADWRVIEFTGRSLVELLARQIALEMPSDDIDVHLVTPHAFSTLKNATKPTVSFFLYRIMENPETRNLRMRTLPDGRVVRQPLTLELSYLVTAWGVHGDDLVGDSRAVRDEHRLLGLVMQTFYDRSELSATDLYDEAPRIWTPSDSIQLVLESLPIEDHYRIWDSSGLPYRLSVTYRARVVALDSAEAVRPPRVLSADFERSGALR